MYESFRNEVLTKLSEEDHVTIASMISVLDRVAEGYDIKRKEVGLLLYYDELPESVKVYLVCKKMAGLSEETLDSYKLVLSIFFLMVKKPPTLVTTNDIRMWLYAYQSSRNVSNRTLDKYREIVGRYFSWAAEEGHILGNPAKNVEQVRFEERQREALSQVQLEYLRAACESARESAIIEMLFSTGCRVSELTGLKKTDIDWRTMTVHLFGKGRKHRYSFINARAEVALKAYLDSRSDKSEYLFVSMKKPHGQLHKDGIEKIVREISKRVSIGKDVTPHILRHTTATLALYNGMPIEDISKLLGHKSVDTTMIYAQTSIENVRNGHRKYIV